MTSWWLLSGWYRISAPRLASALECCSNPIYYSSVVKLKKTSFCSRMSITAGQEHMLNVCDFLPTSTVISVAAKVKLPDSIEHEVEALWQMEQTRRGAAVFNSSLLSAVESSSQQIVGRVVEYRLLVAQRARPELYDVLQVRPVAVSGLLECADGIVFGRRAATVTQDAGLWELVPSGGLDASKFVPGEVDYRDQILLELHEEVGVGLESLSSARPFCLIEGIESHVLDIGIAMMSPLAGDALVRMHHVAGSLEYEELRVVARAELAEFMRREAANLVEVSAALISRLFT